MLCWRSDSLLDWVKFIYLAGDTSSCDMVVTVLRDVFSHLFLRLTAAHSSSNLFFSSIVVFFDPLLQESRGFDPCDLCHGNIRALFTLSSSEVVSVMHNHSSTKAFFEVLSIGIYFTSAFSLTACYPISLVIKCWCGTIAARFSQVAQRHSHVLCRFSLLDVPSRWWRQLHVVRAIKCVRPPHLMLARWRNLPGYSCCSFYVVLFRIDAFRKNTDDLPSVQFCCLDNVLPAPWFPSFWPDSPSFRSCLSLPPGFLDTRVAGTCAGSRALSSFLVCFLTWLHPCRFMQGHSGNLREMSLFKRCGNVKALDWCEFVFGVSTIYSEYAWARSKITTSCCDEISSFVVDCDATNFLKTVSLCNVCLCTTAAAVQSVVSFAVPLISWQVGFANGSPSWYRSTTHSRRPF